VAQFFTHNFVNLLSPHSHLKEKARSHQRYFTMVPNAQDALRTDADDVEVVLNANTQDSEMQTSCVLWEGKENQEDEEEEDPVSASWIRPSKINFILRVAAALVSSQHATHHGKFGDYDLVVDPDQDDSANEIKLCSIKRPHMRAFHCSWWSYHVAFLMW
jgi:hypothetical protein